MTSLQTNVNISSSSPNYDAIPVVDSAVDRWKLKWRFKDRDTFIVCIKGGLGVGGWRPEFAKLTGEFSANVILEGP